MSDDLDNDDDFMVDDDDDYDNDHGVDSGDEDDFDLPVAPKKTSKNVLKESTNRVSSSASAPTKATTNNAKRTKAVEETYQKLTPHEVSTSLLSLNHSLCTHFPPIINHLPHQSITRTTHPYMSR